MVLVAEISETFDTDTLTYLANISAYEWIVGGGLLDAHTVHLETTARAAYLDHSDLTHENTFKSRDIVAPHSNIAGLEITGWFDPTSSNVVNRVGGALGRLASVNRILAIIYTVEGTLVETRGTQPLTYDTYYAIVSTFTAGAGANSNGQLSVELWDEGETGLIETITADMPAGETLALTHFGGMNTGAYGNAPSNTVWNYHKSWDTWVDQAVASVYPRVICGSGNVSGRFVGVSNGGFN